MSFAFPFGYSSPPAKLTPLEAQSRLTWSKLDGEFRDRLLAMFADAASKGVELGLGGGWRSSEVQRRVFLERHVQVPSGGCCTYMGRRFMLKPGNAHAAPPGLSYHEETQVDGDALAADLIGDLFWMNANCYRFKLVHFGGVNREPWHVQPVEIPTGRPRYNGAELEPWRPPATPTPTADDEDEMPIVTNAEPFFGAAVGVAKFAVQDNGRLKLLSEPEWRARGSKPGSPLANADIGALGVDS